MPPPGGSLDVLRVAPQPVRTWAEHRGPTPARSSPEPPPPASCHGEQELSLILQAWASGPTIPVLATDPKENQRAGEGTDGGTPWQGQLVLGPFVSPKGSEIPKTVSRPKGRPHRSSKVGRLRRSGGLVVACAGLPLQLTGPPGSPEPVWACLGGGGGIGSTAGWRAKGAAYRETGARVSEPVPVPSLLPRASGTSRSQHLSSPPPTEERLLVISHYGPHFLLLTQQCGPGLPHFTDKETETQQQEKKAVATNTV